jgi:aspartate kinase
VHVYRLVLEATSFCWKDDLRQIAGSYQENIFMIVMKFGGASLASPDSVNRVVSIVLSEVKKASAHPSSSQANSRYPAVVVSAAGDTTDHLLEILSCASRAQSYLAWKLQERLKTYHFCLAEDLLLQKYLPPVDQYMRIIFRDLHVRIAEVCRGEHQLTPELRDWVMSLGERLSTRIIAAALDQRGMPVRRIDSEKLILTDDHFTNAGPRYWETYARIRWSIPIAALTHVVVVGGFVGATEDGRTTTLGRGGSDLTASIIGAAVNAGEIQIWKDVDGMLTWDPRIKPEAARVRSLSYAEANELAQAGAPILHPETIAPARRLRIPLVIRNTFRPDCEGTRIGVPTTACLNPVKSVVCNENVTLVELRSPSAPENLADFSAAIRQICRKEKAIRFLAGSDDVLYLALDGGNPVPEVDFAASHCVQARIRTRQVIVTLVGEGLRHDGALPRRISAALAQHPVLVLPPSRESRAIQIAIPEENFAALSDVLENLFFSELDLSFFARTDWPGKATGSASNPKGVISEQDKTFPPAARRFALSGLTS